MMKTSNAITAALHDNRALTTVEYALVAAMMVAIAGAAMGSVGTAIAHRIQTAAAALAPPIPPHAGELRGDVEWPAD